MSSLKLPCGYTTQVDPDILDLVKSIGLKWRSYSARRTRYVGATVLTSHGRGNHRRLFLHWLVLSESLGPVGRFLMRWGQVDHVNGDGLDNRRSNLRLVSNSQNHQNQKTRRDSKTGLKGVHHHVSGKYVARIVNPSTGRSQYLGIFKTKEEASSVYQEAAKKLFGEYNFYNKKETSNAVLRR